MKLDICPETGFITYDTDTGAQCLGYLWRPRVMEGAFDPTLGRLSTDLTQAQVDAHNKALDAALIKGLDDSCKIGQGGSFYVSEERDGHGFPVKRFIKTFLGTLVSDQCSVVGRTLVFRRGGKAYRGRLSAQHDLFNFRRVR